MLELGWPVPARMLDLFAEFRVMTNGMPLQHGNGLLGAMLHFGLDALDAAEKEEWRELAMRGGPYTAMEQTGLLDYCESDVTALAVAAGDGAEDRPAEGAPPRAVHDRLGEDGAERRARRRDGVQ
jgi:hypothetical protein